MKDIENNRNVYILGAGFSVEAGLPIVRDFLRMMRVAASWYESQKMPEAVSHFAVVFTFRKNVASAAYRMRVDIDDIEQLFSLASALDIAGDLTESLKLSIALTLNYAKKIHKDRPVGRYIPLPIFRQIESPTALNGAGDNQFGERITQVSLRSYDFIAGSLTGLFTKGCEPADNHFITFNYDLILEEALQRLSIPYTYNLRQASLATTATATENQGIPIHKLHGSINWAFGKGNSEKMSIHRDFEEIFLNGHSVQLVPPTWQKIMTGPLMEAWSSAITSIKSATRLVICGFSVPETDTHFKYLLAAGLQENISLEEIVFINPFSVDTFNEKVNSLFSPSFAQPHRISHRATTIRQFCEHNAETIGRAGDRIQS